MKEHHYNAADDGDDKIIGAETLATTADSSAKLKIWPRDRRV
jgi:hypothetical protein